jgi:hypothetical protein
MIRGVLPLLLVGTAGCSLLLDFSEDQIPKDATADSAFSQAECDFKEPNDNALEAALFDVSEVGPGAVCERTVGLQDRDFYKFTVPAGIVTVTVSISFLSSATGDLDLRLYDGAGAAVLASSVGFMDTEQIVCPGQSPTCAALAEGEYLFEVFSPVAGGANRYDISLQLAM